MNLKKNNNLKVSIRRISQSAIAEMGREKSATGRYIYMCLYCVYIYTIYTQWAASQHTRVCVCVWYSCKTKSARTGHVSFSQTLSTERNGLYLQARSRRSARSQLFELFLSSSIIRVCVCVCTAACVVRLYLFTISKEYYIHSSPPIQRNRIHHQFFNFVFFSFTNFIFRFFFYFLLPSFPFCASLWINGALVNFKSWNPTQQKEKKKKLEKKNWKKRRRGRQSAISSAKLMKVVPSLSIPPSLLYIPFFPFTGKLLWKKREESGGWEESSMRTSTIKWPRK